MNFFTTFIICIIYVIPIIYTLIKKEKEEEIHKIKNFIKNNVFEIFAIIIIIIGVFIRVIDIDKVPTGLNQDEVSSAYEAFSILKYGIDRNNNSFPVHLVAWGSGQNAFYTYLIIPFLIIFKNTNITIRLPMALLSSASLVFMYYITKKEFGNKKSLIYLFIFSILPWHILKSRWGLESNVFPELIMYAVFFLYMGLKNNKIKYQIISSIIFGISTYSYGTSYFFIPLMLFLILLNCLILKKIKLKNAILIFIITGLVALPMIIFVIINFFELNSITIFNITIPKLSVVRFKEITSLNENKSSMKDNLKKGFKVLWDQHDDTALNFADKSGIYYSKKLGLPFMFLGILIAIVQHKKNLMDLIINYWFLISLLLIGMVDPPNINRINTIFIPMSYYISRGIIESYNLLKKALEHAPKKLNIKYIEKIPYIFVILVVLIYTSKFKVFAKECFNEYQEKSQRSLTYELDSAFYRINEINKEKNTTICVTLFINQPYIFWLWYNQIDVNEFINDSEILNQDTMFHYVRRIGNVYFGLPEILDEKWIYIIADNDLERYDLTGYTIEKYDKYNVIYK